MKNSFIVGEKVYLRPITKKDLNENYREWFNDEEVCRYNFHHRFPNYDENMKEYFDNVIKSKKNLILAICDKETDKHIGNVALEDINPVDRFAEFAIVLGDKSFWGKGAGREATMLILKHGFEELNLNRIQCGTLDDNVGMQKVAATVGFKEEGRYRQGAWKRGAFKDIIRYGLVRNEFKG